jgi:hypothetical protein
VADARELFGLLEATHPDPYRGIGGKIEFKRRTRDLLRDLPQDGIATADFADRLSTFLARLGDGHTFVSGEGSKWRDPDPWLPIAFTVTRDGLVILGHDIPALVGKRGHRLDAVAGVPIRELADRLSRELTVENVIGAYARLTNVVRSRKLLANLVPEIAEAQTVELRLQSPKGRRVTVSIPFEGSAEPPAQWSEPTRRWSEYQRGDVPYASRFFDHGRVAYLRVGDMMGREGFESMLRTGWGDPQAALADYHRRHELEMPADIEAALRNVPSLIEVGQALLQRMKAEQTEALIVDLRGNTGGVTTTFIVFAQMLYGEAVYGVPFGERFVQVPSPLLLEKYRTTFEDYRKGRGAEIEPGDYRFGEHVDDPAVAREDAVKSWVEAKMSYGNTMQQLGPDPIYTPPRVVALCDAGTFSAGFHAVYFLDQLGATVVGVPPMQSPNAFMEVTPFRLSASKLTGGISNSAHLLLPDDPTATLYPPKHELDASILARYDYDTETSLRWALDLLARQRAREAQ